MVAPSCLASRLAAGSRAPAGSDYHTLGVQHFLGPRGALEGLRRLLDAGKVRHVGFVCRGNDAPYVRELLATGMFGMLNVPYKGTSPALIDVMAGRAEIMFPNSAVVPPLVKSSICAAVSCQ